MKKTAILVSLALILSLGLFTWITRTNLGTSRLKQPKPNSDALTYLMDHPTGVSLDPLESDYSGNAIVIKHLVGTLVRYANGGQFEPYLAKEWKSLDGGSEWTFSLQPNLHCEDGESITPTGYVNGLTKVLSLYKDQGAIPIISQLLGWNAFAAGGALSGVSVNSDGLISFKFQTPVGNGFLEYLSMPYYGYVCASNFDGPKWRSKFEIISSGPYQLSGPILD
ncbi:MAG: hypothetical protein EOP06_21725, partial [Proteobacteria bacterium]